MRAAYDIVAIGNALVDVIAPCDEAFLTSEGLAKGSMTLVEEARAQALYRRMAAAIETSGGTAANTVAGVASFGGRASFIGKVADDGLGAVFGHDIRAIGAAYATPPLRDGPSTGRCLVNVTPDAERTMCTYLGAAVKLSPNDVAASTIQAASALFLEGYLFDPPEARRAFAKAAGLARAAGRTIALSLSDSFLVERHREALLAFIESQVDVVLANAAEVCSLFPSLGPEEAIRRLTRIAGIAAVTFGERGSRVATATSSHDIAARPIERVVDSTGAGDQYAAGFLFGLARDQPLTVCAELGALAAAEVITHYGPRPQASLKDLVRAAEP
ncbi:MAG TPA: adenosine kinase [Caulobacteraceae bacterium]|nr:adenosine kinase [Caulobacteraceae bacterium]